MRELPQRLVLERVARETLGRRNGDQPRHLRLHRFYESETPRPEIEEWGALEKLKISTDENFAQVSHSSAILFRQPPSMRSAISPTNSTSPNETLFEERIQQHRIRDCHGDLHLDHVHLTPEATTIFDCIEFNDRFRFIDIANDLAFLAMDFDFESRSDLESASPKCGARIPRSGNAAAH